MHIKLGIIQLPIIAISAKCQGDNLRNVTIMYVTWLSKLKRNQEEHNYSTHLYFPLRENVFECATLSNVTYFCCH